MTSHQHPNMEHLALLYTNISGLDSNVTVPLMGHPAEEESSFFETYYSPPRFAVETLFASMAVLSNSLALIGIPNANDTRNESVYHILFVNLAAANVVACVLQWLCNNLLYLFGDYIDEHINQGFSMCELFVYLIGAVFASWAFGIVSTLTLIGFATVQYFAICKPLHHVTIVTRQRVCAFIGCSWVLSILGGFLPFLLVFLLARRAECDLELLEKLTKTVIIGGNVCIGLVALMYVVIVSLCVRIYIEIHRLQRRMSQFRFDQRVQSERKAFVTSMILLSTLTIFYIPYTVVYLVSMSMHSGFAMEHKGTIFFMSLLPYCKFFSDPVIYGMRMREVREGCLRLALKCGLVKCGCFNVHELLSPASPSVQTTTYSLHPLGSVTLN